MNQYNRRLLLLWKLGFPSKLAKAQLKVKQKILQIHVRKW